ncbi:MAG: SpoIIE family protein phosphatase [Acidobacteriota bacterium]
MKLRLKLILAFLLLSVVPLLVVVTYSYYASQRVFRSAVEAEVSALAEDMGRRMVSVRRDLGRQLERLSRLPFRQFMTLPKGGFDLRKDAAVSELREILGPEEHLVDSLEFIPSHPPLPQGGPGQHPVTSASVAPSSAQAEAERIIIHTSRLLSGSRQSGPAERNRPEVPVPEPPSPPPVPGSQQDTQPSQGAVEPPDKGAVPGGALERWAQMSQKDRDLLEEQRKRLSSLLGRELGSEIRRRGELIGTLKAQVNPDRILNRLFLRARRHQNEIAFAVDASGRVYTADPADQSLLANLPLTDAQGSKGGIQNLADMQNWIVVTRKDAESGLSFGIARPIRQSLEEIRRTAVRNFGYGMAVVGLALLGILPLSGRLTRNLTLLTRGAEQLAQGNLQVQVPVRSKDELGQLARTFNRMAQQLHENQLHVLEQERLRRELEMCRQIQEDLLPRSSLRFGMAEVRGISIPAREVGGDFFNYFPLANGDMAILVGDVSGKGVPAALLMANLQATLRARLPVQPDLAVLAEQLDREIAATTPPELFLTLFMGILESNGSRLRYVNAGHNPQYALRRDDSFQRMQSTGRPLGLLPGAGYGEARLHLAAGDSIFLYTDGLVEAENDAGEEFGNQQLEAILVRERANGLENLIGSVEQAVRSHRGRTEASDDATLLVLKLVPGINGG